MKPISRVMIALAALALLALLIVPIWRIDLQAPQYPEGLFIHIYADHFAGDVEKINVLNHYIGMATIHLEMLPGDCDATCRRPGCCRCRPHSKRS